MSVSAGPDIIESGLIYHVDPSITKSTRDRSYNLHPNPLDIFGFLGSGFTNGCRVSRDTTELSPIGGIPMRMDCTGADAHIGTYNSSVYNIAPARIGDTWTVSVWARANRATTGQIFIFENNNNGNSFLQAPALTINITTSWQRFSYTYTMVNPGTQYMQTRLDGPDTFDGATVWWDGWQIEKSSTMSAFTAKISNTIYDVSGNNFNGTIVNNVAYTPDNGGILTFDGVKDFVSFSTGSRPIISTRTGFTIGLWIFQSPTQSNSNWNYFYLFFPLEMGTFGTNAGTFSFKDNNAPGNPTLTTGNISLGWNYIAFGTNSNQIPFMYHYNATTATLVNAGAFIAQDYVIDKLCQGITAYTSYYGGRIGQIQIYNRALTTAEVVQNFTAHRSRYGI